MTAAKSVKNNICPYLGMKNDANSHIAFPSPVNYCNRCTPAARVNLRHQEVSCLDGVNYLKCEVYIDGAEKPLPKPLRYLSSSTRSSSYRQSPYLFVLIVGLILFGAILWVVNFTNTPEPVLSTIVPTVQPADQVVAETVAAIAAMQTSQSLLLQTPTLSFNGLTPSVTPTVTLFPTLTLTSTITNTVTFTPTITPSSTSTQTVTASVTATSPYSLEIPIGDQKKFVIHRVVAGENLNTIAERFGSTVETIVAVNYSLPSPIKANTLVIIPLKVNVSLNLPVLEPYQVTSSKISIEEISTLVNADLGLLRLYNNSMAGQVFTKGNWLLIPHTNKATPAP